MAPVRREKQKTRTTPVGVRLDKSKGQHLLRNPGIVDKILAACSLKSSEDVLEIGPGTGNLTIKLLPLVRRVTAWDIDERMVGEVRKRALSLGYTNLDVRHGDALKTDLGKFDVCAANLPYQISSPFIFKLIAHRPLFRCAVLMFQLEFAERLMARPNSDDYCRLSLNVQLFCKVERVCKVDRKSFNPPPKVDSMVVRLQPRRPPISVNFREWDGMLRVAFMRKKKTLAALFKMPGAIQMLQANYDVHRKLQGLPPDPTFDAKSVALSVLEACSLSSERAYNLSMDQYLHLLLEFNKRGLRFCNVGVNEEGQAASLAKALEALVIEEVKRCGKFDD